MIISENEIHCLKVVHRKPDNFLRVFEFEKIDETPFDLSTVNLRWDFFKDGAALFSIYGQDVEITDNFASFSKNASFFSALPLIGEYTHRFYDTISNTTIFDGTLVLEGSVTMPTIYYSFYGPSAISVSTESQVKALPYAAIESLNGFTLPTGTAQTKFIIAIPASKSIDIITDQTAINLNITDQYEPAGTIEVDGVDYDIFEMTLAIPYSTNHNHIVSLQ